MRQGRDGGFDGPGDPILPRSVPPDETPRGVAAAAGPTDEGAKRPARKPDEPNSPHHAEHDDPAERVKTATRKAGETARRVKRKGASGIRGGTSED